MPLAQKLSRPDPLKKSSRARNWRALVPVLEHEKSGRQIQRGAMVQVPAPGAQSTGLDRRCSPRPPVRDRRVFQSSMLRSSSPCTSPCELFSDRSRGAIRKSN